MPQGIVTTYNLNVGVIVNIEDLIAQLDPFDVPVIGGGGEGGRLIGRDDSDIFEKKYEWLDDTLLTPKALLEGSIDASVTALVLETGDTNAFTVGDILLIGDEFVRVTACASDGITLTVTRAYGGSTAATHADGVTIIGVGRTLPEGSDPGTVRSVDRTQRYNMTQIFGPEPVQVSGTEAVIRKYGLRGTSEFNYQAGQRLKEQSISLEQAVQYGVRAEDTSAKTRSMGGLNYYITDVIDSSTTTLTEALWLDQLQTIFDNGGSPKVTLAGAKQKRVISKFVIEGGGVSNIRAMKDDNTAGRVVDRYVSDFGILSVALSRWTDRRNIFNYDPEQVTLKALRPFQFEMLAKTGDSMKGQIVGEYTLCVRRQKHAGKFTALT